MGGQPPTPATGAGSTTSETTTALTVTDSAAANSLWASNYAAGHGSALAAAMDAGFAVVLFVFLAVVVYQWRKGRKAAAREENEGGKGEGEGGGEGSNEGRGRRLEPASEVDTVSLEKGRGVVV